ncbi:hypothetical protein KKP04_10080 [Rhodomicrobium sp. Az07]|uniref:baeRF3 domain-containing protein n=1 Tax=Rhodomicrobium sp. Az07 TaxID=2839034 RepID=UPI001BEC4990|nr:hypothetical protein [Rhodomicrobium sp. Az07]MBT3071218.1 hypothetical protein [Rhodomicrobium sp. Az07]
MLYLDRFTDVDYCRLDEIRADHCVSIYIPTNTVSLETEQDKILFKNATQRAMTQLADAGADKRRVSEIEARLKSLADDTLLWNHMAEGLAVFATPDAMETYRLPRTVSVEVEVSDRFHLKPLIPLLAFPHTAYVLDIAQAQVRFLCVTEGQMKEIEVPSMPTSFDDAMAQRTADGESVEIRQDEHRKVRQRQFARAIEEALRPVLLNRKAPLVLAGVDTMLTYYRDVDTYPHTEDAVISGNQEHRRADEFAAEVRAIVSRRFESTIADRLDRVEALRDDRRSSTDVTEIAHAAQEGRVESLVVAVDHEIYGTLTGGIGSIAPRAPADAATYDILDKVVALTLRQGGEVIGARKKELPDGFQIAAIFRYAR